MDWYCGSTKHTAIAQWAALTAYSVGDIVRQLAAPSAGNERAFRCTTAGTSGASEPTWTLTQGGVTSGDGTAEWTEVTGNNAYGWLAAHNRLTNSLAWMAAGDRLWISDNHAFSLSNAQNNIFSPGTAAAPCQLICVDDSATPPTTKATTGSETTTADASFSFNGFAYCYGMTFSAGTGVTNSSLYFTSSEPWYWRFDACSLRIVGSGSVNAIYAGINNSAADDNLLELVGNTTLKFANASDRIFASAPVRWINSTGLVAGGTVPTSLCRVPSNVFSKIYVSGVDLSAFGSGKSLVDQSGGGYQDFYFENCKLGSSVSITTGTIPGQGGATVRLVNCDSADTNYRYHLSTYQGTVSHETVIVRTGGASDGTTPISRKLISTANSKFFSPLTTDPIVIWNELTGSSQTITVEIITDNVTLTDAEIWLEIEYLGTSGFPISSFVSDQVSDPIFGTPANQATSSVDWTTTGLTTPVKQKLSASFTAQEKGPIRVKVMLAKPSTTVYVDPFITIN